MVRPQALPPGVSPDTVAGLAEDARARLYELDPATATVLPDYLKQLAAWPPGRSYRAPPPEAEAFFEAARERGGPDLEKALNRAALLVGLVATRAALVDHPVWPEALCSFDDVTAAIVHGLGQEPPPDWPTFVSDLFAKDMAVAAGWALPARSALIEPRGGVALSDLVHAGPRWGLHASLILSRLGGRRYYYSVHVYDRLLPWFSEEGWREGFRLMALALERDPIVRGVIGVSWYRDPAIVSVSPHLAYLHDFPAERGARFVRIGHKEWATLLATEKSATRRKLSEEGKYQPMEYLMVWPRREMLDWLHNGAR